MRRVDREITDPKALEAIIRGVRVCHLALCDGGTPYVVPLSFGYSGGCLYFHSAKVGRKIDILKRNPRVGFCFEAEPQLRQDDVACRWGFGYRSVVGFGEAVVVEDSEEKRRGLEALMAQYDQRAYTFEEEEIRRVAVIRVDIEGMTGKGNL